VGVRADFGAAHPVTAGASVSVSLGWRGQTRAAAVVVPAANAEASALQFRAESFVEGAESTLQATAVTDQALVVDAHGNAWRQALSPPLLEALFSMSGLLNTGVDSASLELDVLTVILKFNALLSQDSSQEAPVLRLSDAARSESINLPLESISGSKATFRSAPLSSSVRGGDVLNGAVVAGGAAARLRSLLSSSVVWSGAVSAVSYTVSRPAHASTAGVLFEGNELQLVTTFADAVSLAAANPGAAAAPVLQVRRASAESVFPLSVQSVSGSSITWRGAVPAAVDGGAVLALASVSDAGSVVDGWGNSWTGHVAAFEFVADLPRALSASGAVSSDVVSVSVAFDRDMSERAAGPASTLRLTYGAAGELVLSLQALSGPVSGPRLAVYTGALPCDAAAYVTFELASVSGAARLEDSRGNDWSGAVPALSFAASRPRALSVGQLVQVGGRLSLSVGFANLVVESGSASSACTLSARLVQPGVVDGTIQFSLASVSGSWLRFEAAGIDGLDGSVQVSGLAAAHPEAVVDAAGNSWCGSLPVSSVSADVLTVASWSVVAAQSSRDYFGSVRVDVVFDRAISIGEFVLCPPALAVNIGGVVSGAALPLVAVLSSGLTVGGEVVSNVCRFSVPELQVQRFGGELVVARSTVCRPNGVVSDAQGNEWRPRLPVSTNTAIDFSPAPDALFVTSFKDRSKQQLCVVLHFDIPVSVSAPGPTLLCTLGGRALRMAYGARPSPTEVVFSVTGSAWMDVEGELRVSGVEHPERITAFV
jgi:hypothetical protein